MEIASRTNKTDITSTDAWGEALKLATASSKLLVAFFWAQFHEPSKLGGQMDQVFTTLAQKYSGVSFVKVEADKHPDITSKYPVSSVPTFIFIRNGENVGKVEGANPPELAKRVQLLSAKVTVAEDTKEKTAEALNRRIARLIASAPFMVFMKGTPDEPKCKFSRAAMELLKEHNIPFGSFNILGDDAVRQGIKTYSNWPTFPQFYKNAELIGGLDIVKEILEEEGSLDSLRVSVDAAAPKPMSLNDRLASLIGGAKCMLFMKGSPDAPQCGFSQKTVALLKSNNIEFASFDILTDNDVRQGLKTYSNWPTFPQFYVDSTLIGGLDILNEMAEDGDLKGELGL